MVHPDANEPPYGQYPEINITWHDSVSQATFEDEAFGVANDNEDDVNNAVVAAQQAFEPGSLWRNMDALQRGHLLYKLADLIKKNRKYLTLLEILDNGKPLTDEYRSHVVRCYRYFAWWASKLHGKTLPDHGPHLCFTSREPVGIVGQIISGDSTLLMQAWTLGPALCAGNTVVLKFAQWTPLTALHVASLIKEAGFPPGVVNIVPGDGSTGAAVANHPDINKVVFMGSTEVGHQVLQEDGVNSLKVTLCYELGFKGPTGIFVFADTDLDDVVEKCYFAPHLIFYKDQPHPLTYVQESIYDEFMRRIVKRARRHKPCRNVEDICLLIVTMSGIVMMFEHIDNVFTNDTHPKYGLATIFTTNVIAAKDMVANIRAGIICINCFDAFYVQAPL